MERILIGESNSSFYTTFECNNNLECEDATNLVQENYRQEMPLFCY